MTSRLALRLSLATTFALAAIATAVSCSSDESSNQPLGDEGEILGGKGGAGGGKAGSSGAGGTTAGSGGTDAGSGGSDAGSGGTDAGSGGSDAGSGGSDAGSGGTDAGSGGSDAGSGGTDAGSGGSDAGSGGTDAGAGGTDAGSGGSDAGSGGSEAGASGSSGEGGSGGSSGEAGTGGSEQGGSGGTEQGGSGGTGGDDDPMPEQIGGSGGAPLSWSCDKNLGLWATSAKIKFDGETPTALASAFSEISGGTHPISLVLRSSGGDMTGAVSATTTNGSGKEVFPSGNKPMMMSAIVPFGDTSSLIVNGAQDTAYLRFIDKQGPVLVKVTHVIWKATQTSESCDDLTVTLSGEIRGSAINTSLKLASGTKTIAEICGLPPGSENPAPCDQPMMCNDSIQTINITFQGEPMSFDFSAL